MKRRSFLLAPWAATAKKKTVAAIVTEYRPMSHADVICGRILDGYMPNNQRAEPRTRIVSMYTDQIAAKDMSRDLSARHGFKIYPTIAEALTLGGDRLAVDAVLLIGEHGNYPTNDRGQKLYPRFELYQQIIEIFRRGGRAVPLFCDKHLSYSWEKARKMYDQARELRFAFMAGSSIPVTLRVPELELPLGCQVEQALIVGYGDVDAYGFHTLEALQCMIERRAGGEKGVAGVRMIEGDAVWKWRDSKEGQWTAPLLETALTHRADPKPGTPEQNVKNPVLFVVDYRDGLRAVAYMLNGHASDWIFAGKLRDKADPLVTHFGFKSGGRQLPHFDGLVRCIEEMFVTGKPVYPVERTLLTTGILSFLFESRVQEKYIETPELKVEYKVPGRTYFQRAGLERQLDSLRTSARFMPEIEAT